MLATKFLREQERLRTCWYPGIGVKGSGGAAEVINIMGKNDQDTAKK